MAVPLFLLLGLLCAVPLPAQAPAPDQLAALRARAAPRPLDSGVTVFTHVRVLPMDGERTLEDQAVVIRLGRIAQLGPAATVRRPAGARVIDGRGATLLPGLADMHVHLRYGADTTDNPAVLQLLLINGVTTALNMFGVPDHLRVRAAIDQGRLLGPTLYTTGFYMNAPYVRTGAQVDSAVRAQQAAGYDMIKVHGELPEDAFHALFAAARAVGIPVVGHAVHALGLRALLAEHQYAIAHVEEYLYAWFGFRRTQAIPADSVRPLIDIAARETAAAGVWVMPTLAVFQGIVPQMTALDSVLASPEARYLPPSFVREWSAAANPYANRQRFPLTSVEGMSAQARLLSLQTLALRHAGVRLVLGTDMGVPGMAPGFSVHQELAALVAAGLSPYEALRAATADAAMFVAGEQEFGTITPGRRADLLLVRGDPLRDIGVLRRPVGVMLRGRWFPWTALERMLARFDRAGH